MQNACGLVAVVVLAEYPAANLEPSADDKEVRTGKMLVGGQDKSRLPEITHQSVIKTTFVLYFAMLAGIRAACNAMGAVSIIGRWKPFV